MKKETGTPGNAPDTRERILQTASELFYREGTRAVGVDLIVAQAGVAKTSLYRYFTTKDDLIEAFLLRETPISGRMGCGGRAIPAHAARGTGCAAAMDRRAHCAPGYRGCPQINIAAEYADGNHPARKVAVAHKQELRRRLTELADAMGVDEPETFALRLATVIDGALSSGQALHAHGRGFPAGIRATAVAEEGPQVSRPAAAIRAPVRFSRARPDRPTARALAAQLIDFPGANGRSISACVCCHSGNAAASRSQPAGVSSSRRLRRSSGSWMIVTRPRRSSGLSAAVSVVRSIASSDATDFIGAGWGRFSDISSENWPLVRSSGRSTSSKIRARLRRALHVQAQAAIAHHQRRFEGELFFSCHVAIVLISTYLVKVEARQPVASVTGGTA